MVYFKHFNHKAKRASVWVPVPEAAAAAKQGPFTEQNNNEQGSDQISTHMNKFERKKGKA